MTGTTAPRLARRPVLLAIAGDSAAGKTTLTDGLVEALGKDQCRVVKARVQLSSIGLGVSLIELSRGRRW